jgi:hypothetical protein
MFSSLKPAAENAMKFDMSTYEPFGLELIGTPSRDEMGLQLHNKNLPLLASDRAMVQVPRRRCCEGAGKGRARDRILVSDPRRPRF